GKAVADLRDPERHGLRDRRLRQLAVDDSLKDLLAGLAGDLGRIWQAIPEARRLHGVPLVCIYKLCKYIYRWAGERNRRRRCAPMPPLWSRRAPACTAVWRRGVSRSSWIGRWRARG